MVTGGEEDDGLDRVGTGSGTATTGEGQVLGKNDSGLIPSVQSPPISPGKSLIK